MKAALVLLATLGLSAHAIAMPKTNRLPIRSEAVETEVASEEFDSARFGDVDAFEADLSTMTAEEMAQEFNVDLNDIGAREPGLFTPIGGEYLQIVVDIDSQRLYMTGSQTPEWRAIVSTGIGRGKGITGRVIGKHNPTFLSQNHRSKKYNMAPMPWAVFFSGNFALHETPHVKQLGTKASHGCVRQNHQSAKYVFQTVAEYVRVYGKSSVDIYVQ